MGGSLASYGATALVMAWRQPLLEAVTLTNIQGNPIALCILLGEDVIPRGVIPCRGRYLVHSVSVLGTRLTGPNAGCHSFLIGG